MFTTPDVLPSGQTGWDIDCAQAAIARKVYRQYRQDSSFTRSSAALVVAQWLDTFARYV